MEIGLALLVVAVLAIAIWIIIEVKRMKHKLWAIFLIALLLFLYFSFTFVFSGKEVDYKSVGGVANAAKIYFSWLGSIFGNVKSITTHAIDMDWTENVSKTKEDK